MTHTELVRNYLDSIVRKDFTQLNLSENFRHSSPFGIQEGRENFIEACKLVVAGTQAIEIKKMIEEKDSVCVEYDVISPNGRMAISEWYSIRNGLITEIRAYFDASINNKY